MEIWKQNVEQLKDFMQECGKQPICVAFSGGVDSSLLLQMASDSGKKYGNPVYAVTFDSMLHPSCDLEVAKRVAEEMKAVHIVLQIDELKQEEIKRNPLNRCYLCKKCLFQTLKVFAGKKGISRILDGTNEDDLHVYRPGIQALRELGIESPLAKFHMTKKEVRDLAAEYGISVASRPSAPCMATRLPYGTELNYELLKRIEQGEQYLKTILTGNVRLRVHKEIARIEVDQEEMQIFLQNRKQITDTLKALGFLYITMDLEGFCSGSMDLYENTDWTADK